MEDFELNIKGSIKVLENQIEKEQNATAKKIEALNMLRELLPKNIILDQSADIQVYSLFEKGLIKYAARRSELQETFEREFQSNKNVGAGLPRLKKSGKLIMVRYNGQKGYSFWGLPQWIENNQFKDEFKPERKYLPERIMKVEIVND